MIYISFGGETSETILQLSPDAHLSQIKLSQPTRASHKSANQAPMNDAVSCTGDAKVLILVVISFL